MITQEERNHLVTLRIQQAETTVSEAEQCLAQGLLPAATNRIYYGMFMPCWRLGCCGSLKLPNTSK